MVRAKSCGPVFHLYYTQCTAYLEQQSRRDLINRHREKMWSLLSQAMDLPWHISEDMHWRMGEVKIAELARRHPMNQRSDPASGQELQEPDACIGGQGRCVLDYLRPTAEALTFRGNERL